ncbi:hypothetical protein GCM10010116_41140 [Microbispora rosea subsp. aerata]|nr:hypothetical protein [Microbispora rosea]GGO20500.1 hypothetical protein GCM10010116_41140 [Microbispora rosea subsp. aerata]GIH57150.1 hypothetical protein Mro02_40640 [Microbispora rosea subsp. aerata]GLJ84780.1 hypothetical protein GCM10017588_35080 [Microbispora rosea subsp. aerata]
MLQRYLGSGPTPQPLPARAARSGDMDFGADTFLLPRKAENAFSGRPMPEPAITCPPGM